MNIVMNAGLKWLEDVENDSRELKVKKWKQKAKENKRPE
jgi:hypothetical protein